MIRRFLPGRLAVLLARRTSAVWVAGISLLACTVVVHTQQAVGDEIADSLARLESADADERHAAARALEKNSDVRALEPLMRIIKADVDKGLSYYCSQAIVNMKDPRAVEPLIKHLQDGETIAAAALGNLGDKRAVDPLLTALKAAPAAEYGKRCTIIDALGKLRDAAAVDMLLPLTTDVSPVPTHAIQALGRIGDRRATPALVKILRDDKDVMLRREAAVALGEIADPASAAAVRTAIKDSDPYVSSLAEEAAAKIERRGMPPAAAGDRNHAVIGGAAATTAVGLVSVPADGATAADWTLKTVTIAFPTDMRTDGYSVVAAAGGKIPEPIGDEPYAFRDSRTFVMSVKLEEATDYAFSLNSDRRKDFRRADGTPLPPTVIRFRTGYGNRPNMSASTSATLVVRQTTPREAGDYATIGEAIRQAPPGATITIFPGTYTEAVVLDRSVTLRRKVGEGGVVVIEAIDGPCLLMKTDRATVSDLVLRGKSGTANKSFPAVDVPQGELTLINCDVTTDAHGAVFVHGAGASLVVRKCAVHDAREDGLFFTDGAAGTIEESDIYANGYNGVEIRRDANPTIRNCTIRSGKQAGIFADERGRGDIVNCRIYGNAMGGAQLYGGSMTRVAGTRFSNGKSSGIVVSESAAGVFEDCEITGHERSAIVVSKGGNPVVRRCRMYGNKGAGVDAHEQGRGTFEECEFAANEWCEIAVKSESDPMFRRCDVHDSLQAGVYIAENGKGRFENCTIWATRLSGVEVTSGGKPTFEQCSIRDGQGNGLFCAGGGGTFAGCEFAGHAFAEVYVASGGNPILRKCRLHEGEEGGLVVLNDGRGLFEDCDIYLTDLAGVELRDGANPLLRRCRIYDCKKSGVYVHDRGEGTFEECEIYGNALAGVEIAPAGAPTIRGSTIRDGKQAGVLIRAGAKGTIEGCRLFTNTLDPIIAEEGHGATLKNNQESK